MALITPSQRLAALHSAKDLLTGGENSTLFSKSSPSAPKPLPMIRIAEYILTGVDYRDATPESASNIHGHNDLEEEAKDPAENDEQVKSPIVMTHEEWVNSGGEEGPHANDGVLVMPPENTDEKGDKW